MTRKEVVALSDRLRLKAVYAEDDTARLMEEAAFALLNLQTKLNTISQVAR